MGKRTFKIQLEQQEIGKLIEVHVEQERAVSYTFKATKYELNVPHDGGIYDLNITSHKDTGHPIENLSYVVESNVFSAVEFASSTYGPTSVYVKPNTSYHDRTIVLTCVQDESSKEFEITINQKGKPKETVFTINGKTSETVTVPPEGGRPSTPLKIKSTDGTKQLHWNVVDELPDWIQLFPVSQEEYNAAGADGEVNLNIVISPYNGTDDGE